jgi:hypothetical protein
MGKSHNTDKYGKYRKPSSKKTWKKQKGNRPAQDDDSNKTPVVLDHYNDEA